MTTPVAEPDLDDLLDIARTIRWGKTAGTYHRMLEVLVIEQLNDDQRIEMLVRALTRLVGGPTASVHPGYDVTGLPSGPATIMKARTDHGTRCAYGVGCHNDIHGWWCGSIIPNPWLG